MKTKAERLEEVFRRLRRLPPANSFDQAMKQLQVTITEVEDALTAIPNDPSNWRTDGRLYPPQADMERKGKPGVRVFRSLAHRTFISEGGAIEIRTLTGEVVFSKEDANGKGVGP